MTDNESLNRELCEALGIELGAFGIFSSGGTRLRDRDFDTIDEAQRYIDSEDERLPESQKAAAKGVNIQPCVKAHPDFLSPSVFWPAALEWCRLNGWNIEIKIVNHNFSDFIFQKIGSRNKRHIAAVLPSTDMKTQLFAGCSAWLAAIKSLKESANGQ